MAKFFMDEEKKKAYGEWIKEIRDGLGLSQTKFAARVIRFEVDKKTGMEVCKNFHRNSVKNWEGGKNLPIDISTVVSLALLGYDGNDHEKMKAEKNSDVYLNLDEKARNDRFFEVQTCMKEYMGRQLYARNINDALLIEVARGIYSFEELPLVRQELNQLISQVFVTSEDKKELCNQTMTDSLQGKLMQVNSKRDFRKLVLSEENRKYFYLGGRTVGERLKTICEKDNPYTRGLSLKSAIKVYAPRYQDSYGKMYLSDISVSRDWLIELCKKLRMKTKEIDRILDTARMINLTEADEANGEPPFLWIQERSLEEKFIYAALIAAFVSEYGIDCIPPMDYLYDYFWDNGGIELIQQIREDIQENPESLEENPNQFLREYFDELSVAASIEGLMSYTEKEQEAYLNYCNEFASYHAFPLKNRKNIKSQKAVDAIDVMYFMAAFTYTLFTGEPLKKTISQEDQKRLEDLFGSKGSKLYVVRLFFNNFWVTFLGDKEIYMDREKQAYFMEDGKAKKKFNMNQILEDLCESYLLLKS